MEKNEYIKYVEKTMPRTNEARTLSVAFIVGGIICMFGQLINDLLSFYLKSLEDSQISSITTIIMIFIGAFLTGIGIYDKIGYHAGAGSIIPITGFANSIVSPAMEFNKEGVIYGIMSKMFTISGPVIVSGVGSSVIVGILFFILNQFGVNI